MANEKLTRKCGLILMVTGVVLVVLMLFAMIGGAKVWFPLGLGAVFTGMGWQMKRTGKFK